MNKKIKIFQADITTLAVDAIVNAANESLLGGGGVDGAIHQSAGPKLLIACRKLNGCRTGDAKITSGFDLPARYIIHTVGPIWQMGKANEEKLLTNCYQNSLDLAVDKHIKSLAFPAISCGVYGYPPAQAARIALRTINNYLTQHPQLETVIICCFSQSMVDIYQAVRLQLAI